MWENLVHTFDLVSKLNPDLDREILRVRLQMRVQFEALAKMRPNYSDPVEVGRLLL